MQLPGAPVWPAHGARSPVCGSCMRFARRCPQAPPRIPGPAAPSWPPGSAGAGSSRCCPCRLAPGPEAVPEETQRPLMGLVTERMPLLGLFQSVAEANLNLFHWRPASRRCRRCPASAACICWTPAGWPIRGLHPGLSPPSLLAHRTHPGGAGPRGPDLRDPVRRGHGLAALKGSGGKPSTTACRCCVATTTCSARRVRWSSSTTSGRWPAP